MPLLETLAEAALRTLAGVTHYVTDPYVWLSHGIGVTLLVWLRRTAPDVTHISRSLLVGETVSVALWACVPEAGLAAILATALWIYLYERKAGPRVKVQDNAVFFAREEFAQILLNIGPEGDFRSWCDPIKPDTKLILTSLQFVDYWKKFFGKPWSKAAVDVDCVTEIREGWSPDLALPLWREGIKHGNCFYLAVGQCRHVTYICEDSESRDRWLDALTQVATRQLEINQEIWYRGLVEDCGLEHVWTAGATLEDVLILLDRANRPAGKSYIKEIFQESMTCKPRSQAFARASSGKADESRLDCTQLRRCFFLALRRPDIQEIYDRLLYRRRGEVTLSAHRLKEFMATEQQEHISHALSQEWITEHEPVPPRQNLSAIGFTTFMLSREQQALHRDHLQVCQDMDQPLNHYYIATSHNTYLTKDQVKGRSSVTAYISALKRGCKCVELDIWDGPNNEPIIYHGHTLTSKILFKDVVRAIGEYAFVVSDFPLILSFENHCSMEQQGVMAMYLRDILGDKLYTEPIPENEEEMPSPNALRGYIIIKAKKLIEGQEADDYNDESSNEEDSGLEDNLEDLPNSTEGSDTSKDVVDINEAEDVFPSEDMKINQDNKPNGGPVTERIEDLEPAVNGEQPAQENEVKENRKKSSFFKKRLSATNRSSKKTPKKKNSVKCVQGAMDLSDLVSYCQAVRFRGFEDAIKNQKHYQMSSISENSSIRYIKEQPQQFSLYTRDHLCRIYPAGRRVNSSNLEPVPLWCVGCQLVALNYQTPDRPMLLNQGLFMDNGGSGYVLKPEFLRKTKTGFDPQGPFPSSVERKILTLQVISGTQLPYSKEEKVKAERSLSVHLRISGVEPDRKKDWQTKSVKNNGYHAVWHEKFTWTLHVTELALLMLTVMDRDKYLGHYTIPMTALQAGYRVVPLLNKECLPLKHGSLFIHSSLASPDD